MREVLLDVQKLEGSIDRISNPSYTARHALGPEP